MFWMRLPGCIPLPWPIMDKDLNRNDCRILTDYSDSFQEWLHCQIVIDSFVSFDFGKATLYLIRYPYRHNENGLMMKCDIITDHCITSLLRVVSIDYQSIMLYFITGRPRGCTVGHTHSDR